MYQIYLPKQGEAGEWTTLKSHATLTEHPGDAFHVEEYTKDGQRFFVVSTEVLPNGNLQHVRRVGVIGVLPADAKYTEGEPRYFQWRIRPADLMPSFDFRQA